MLDTNVIVSAVIAPRGPAAELLRSWRYGAFVALTTSKQRSEIEGVLRRPRISTQFSVPMGEIDDLLDLIERDMEDVVVLADAAVHVRDVDDITILACAVEGNADFLVTGDKDLLVLADEPAIHPLRIVTIRELLDVLAAAH